MLQGELSQKGHGGCGGLEGLQGVQPAGGAGCACSLGGAWSGVGRQVRLRARCSPHASQCWPIPSPLVSLGVSSVPPVEPGRDGVRAVQERGADRLQAPPASLHRLHWVPACVTSYPRSLFSEEPLLALGWGGQ